MKKLIIALVMLGGSFASADCKWVNTGGTGTYKVVQSCTKGGPYIMGINLEGEKFNRLVHRRNWVSETKYFDLYRSCVTEAGHTALFQNSFTMECK